MAAAADRLFNEASDLEAAATDGDASLSPNLIAAYNHVIEALETPGMMLPGDVSATLTFAASALTSAAVKTKHHRGEIKTVAAGLTQRLKALGVDVSGDSVVSVLAKQSGAQRAQTALNAAKARIEALTSALGGVPKMMRAAAIGQSAPTIATLLREVSAARPQDPTDGLSNLTAEVSDAVEELTRRCRVLDVELEPSRLDLVLVGMDDVNEAMGRTRGNLLANYYGRQTIAGMTGSREPGSEALGEAHVDDVIAWFQKGDVTASLYADISQIVKEPETQQEPSVFESILTQAIVSALQLGPGLVMKALTGRIAKAMAAPAATAGAPAARDVTAGDVYGLQSGGDLPGPALAKPRVQGLRDVAAAITPNVAAPITAALNAKIGAGVKKGLAGKGKAPLSTVFAEQVREGAVEDMAQRFKQANDLRQSLAMLTPVQVLEVFDEMKARAADETATRRAELVMQWANFVVQATSGLDAAGTVDQFGGGLSQMGKLSGSVQIPVTVTMSPARVPSGHGIGLRDAFTEPARFQWGAVHMRGMSPSGLAELRAADLPMGSAKLHRIYDLTLIDERGARPIGRIDVNPEGVVDASGADVALLAKVGTANPGVWNLTPDIIGADDPNAQEGVRQILSMGNLTTAAIQ